MGQSRDSGGRNGALQGGMGQSREEWGLGGRSEAVVEGVGKSRDMLENLGRVGPWREDWDT